MNDLNKNKLCIGIDLGTTNTSVAISRTDNTGRVIVEDQEIYQSGSDRRMETVPSILYVKNGKEYVGNKAMDLKKNYVQNADDELCYLENTKRYIGTNKKWMIQGKTYTPIDVAEKILSVVMKDAKIKNVVDDSYVCITVPAQFGPDQVNNTKEAAQRAGFINAELFPEPQAAILSFLDEEKDKRENKKLDVSTKKRVLVIDIGGGTCDVCLVDVWQKEDGTYAFKNLGINRDNLGGVDFDRKIATYLIEKYGISEPTPSEFAQLMDIGQTFKEQLSRRIDDLVYEDYDGKEDELVCKSNWKDEISYADDITISREMAGETLDFTLSVSELCETISSLVYSKGEIATNKDEQESYKNMQTLVDTTLKEYEMDIQDIDIVFLTGGMSKCFILKAALYELYQKEIISPEKPLLAVSRGASLLNKYPREQIEENNKMPRSIMIETDGGHFKKLISAGATVPVSNVVEETFKTTSRNAVIIRLFEGKDELDNQLRKLNNVYTIRFDEVQRIGREFQIKYSINRSKQIKFQIEFLDDGTTYNIEAQVQNEGGEE